MRDSILPALVTIYPCSDESLGSLPHTLGNTTLGSIASTAYPASNAAIYIPFTVSELITVRKLFSYNGAAASGNIDVGIYDAAGTRLASTGSTAQSGTNTLQVFDITDFVLVPGKYYLAVAMDNTTGTLFAHTAGIAGHHYASGGVMQEASAFPLPATATFASMAQNFLPMIGLSTRDLV